jgi:hypothetical protein
VVPRYQPVFFRFVPATRSKEPQRVPQSRLPVIDHRSEASRTYLLELEVLEVTDSNSDPICVRSILQVTNTPASPVHFSGVFTR